MQYNSPLYYLLVLLTLLTASATSLAQDMTEGFGQLEAGEFAKAKDFFAGILQDHPDNRTALLCYGRATGLSGDPLEALNIFNGLKSENSNRTEVLLNVAEAHLWNNDPKRAMPVYRELIGDDSTLFVAWLGLANSLAMARQYPAAYETIGQALALEPDNSQARISRKYIILGLANTLANDLGEKEKALALLEENLGANPADQETLLLKGNILLASGKYGSAYEVFGQLNDPTKALINQSVALHQRGKDKKAWQLADSLRHLPDTDENEKFLKQNHYLNALLWNNRLVQAKRYYPEIEKDFSHLSATYLSAARVAMYIADFSSGLANYKKALSIDSLSFGGNLGSADAYHALAQDQEAYRTALQTQKRWPERKEVGTFLEKLHRTHRPEANASYTWSFSSDGSYNRALGISAKLSLSPLLRSEVSYEVKHYLQKGSALQLTKNRWQSELSYQLSPKVNVYTGVVFNRFSSNESARSINYNLLFNARAKVMLHRLYGFTAGYRSELLDFNQALASQNLKAHHLFHRGNFYLPETGTGNYTEVVKTFLSDGNQRFLLFTSLYQQIGKKKHFKTGINYLLLTFGDSKPLDYFSPLRHQQVEGFLHTNYRWSGTAVTEISGEVAWGFQWNDEPAQETIRAKITLSRQWQYVRAECYGQYSTAANTAFNGFSFTEIGGKISVAITKRPVFFGRMQKQSSAQNLPNQHK